jgi:hypothetical protein
VRSEVDRAALIVPSEREAWDVIAGPAWEGNAPTALVLVEGESDAEAVRALAERRGIDLRRRQVHVLAAGGVTNFGRVLRSVRELPGPVTVAGLYDQAEERHVVRALASVGLEIGRGDPVLDRVGPALDRVESALDRFGFFACVADLEDELIRALGVDVVLDLLERQGELRSFETLGKQPQHAGRPIDQQLRRFMGTRATRKVRYGRLLVEALDPARAPDPLRRVLDAVAP